MILLTLIHEINFCCSCFQHIGDHISRQSHVQLVSSPGIITSCPTTLVGPAIQLLAAPSGLRMITATSVDQRQQGIKIKLNNFT